MFGIGIPPTLNLLSNPTSSDSVDWLPRLVFEDLRRDVLRESPELAVLALTTFLNPEVFLLSLLLTSSSSSSLFSVDVPMGTAP
jgi:hypothetical protein